MRCAACLAPITEERQRIAVAGAHVHVFANPLGAIFEIGCFAAAPGVGLVGEASAAFTWFAGTAWQVAVCAACGEHLGWRYARPDGGFFFGLILDRLVSGATPSTASDH
ncbi:MAG: cereblon family protein [Solidesulfovibrio sp. DCME]|uniref:cereblon family protein n=1 Tax=Solidesulfovibrio sp. DCME TaxID=3447380 RepID=UPI003D0B37CE